MDPVSQVLAQSNAGSAQGQGFADFAVQGRQLAQQDRALNFSERRLELEEQAQKQQNAMLDLQKRALSLNNRATGIQIETAMRAAEQEISVKYKLPELVDIQMGFLNSPNGYADQELIERARKVFSQAPALIMTPQGKDIMENITSIPKLNITLNGIKRLSAQAPNGAIVDSFNPQTGAVSFGAGSRAQAVPDKIEIAERMTKLQQILKNSTDPIQKEAAQMELDGLVAQMPAGLKVVTDPTGGVTITSGGSRGDSGGVTTGTTSKLEQQQLGAEKLFSIGREMLPLLTPENVGPQGALNRLLANTGLDRKLGLDASQAIEAETLSRVFHAQVFDTLKSDSNIGVKEVEKLEKAGPSPEQFLTTDRASKTRLVTLLNDAAKTSRANAQARGKAITPMFLTPEEIRSQVQNGELTAEQAGALLDKNAWLFMDEIRRQIAR